MRVKSPAITEGKKSVRVKKPKAASKEQPQPNDDMLPEDNSLEASTVSAEVEQETSPTKPLPSWMVQRESEYLKHTLS